MFDKKHIHFHSQVVSEIMRDIPSRQRAYSLQQGLEMREDCKALFLDARIQKEIPQSIFSLSGLEVLSLKGIKSDFLPSSIIGLGNLRFLDLTGTGINIFPKGMERLPLSAFFITGGIWDNISEWLLQMDNLESIFIGECGIIGIPSNIQQLKKLREINFNKNRISRIPNAIFELKSLRKFFMSENRLKGINTNIGEALQLKELDVSHNKIQEIPSTIAYCERLEKLDVSHNKIIHLPDSIVDCRSLSKLFLNKNNLSTIPKDINKLSLTELDLSENKIELLPEEFRYLSRLKILDISKNNFDTTPSVLVGLKNIKSINIGRGKRIKNKILLSFIHKSNEAEINFEKRVEYLSSYIKNDKSKKELIRLMNCPFRTFRTQAKNEATTKYSVSEIACKKCYLAGRRKKNINKTKELLSQNNSMFSDKYSSEISIIILGGGQLNIPEKFNGEFITEKQLFEFFNKEENVHQDIKLNIPQLKKLFNSDEKNLKLGINIIKNINPPNELIPYLLSVLFTHESKTMRTDCRKILNGKISNIILKYDKRDFNFSAAHIEKILLEIEDGFINTALLAQLVFKKNKKTWLYIYNKGDKEIIEKLSDKKYEIDLSGGQLEYLLEEIFSFHELKKINLSKNRIRIPDSRIFKNFPFLQEINFSQNPIEKIPEEVFEMKSLRILYLKDCPQLNLDKEKWKQKAPWITLFF